MKKTVSIAAKPAAVTARPNPDNWVSGGSDTATNDSNAAAAATAPVATAAADARMKRLTIDIPEDLHTRLKVACARRGTRMADEVRALLEAHCADG
jgi:hypothetical protein